jgi:hypothetical protein
MKKIFTNAMLIALLMTGMNAQAEEYSTAVGLRLGGYSQGITVKHFLNNNGALEGILSWGWRSFLVTGLYEWQKPIPNAAGLAWFVGGGLHLGFYQDGYDYYYYHYRHGNKVYSYYGYDPEERRTVIGADFIIGLEYKIPRAPITLGVDTKPFFDFAQGSYFFWDGAFTARFTF